MSGKYRGLYGPFLVMGLIVVITPDHVQFAAGMLAGSGIVGIVRGFTGSAP